MNHPLLISTIVKKTVENEEQNDQKMTQNDQNGCKTSFLRCMSDVGMIKSNKLTRTR